MDTTGSVYPTLSFVPAPSIDISSTQSGMADPELLSPSSVSLNLSQVSGALQDMKDRATNIKHALAVPPSPGIPPAVFGAGGKM